MTESKGREFFIQMFKYGMVGGIGLVMDAGLFYLLVKILDVPYLIANIISSHCAIINNFILNSIFTFKTKDRIFLRFLGYYSIALIGIGLSSLILKLLIGYLGLDKMLSKFIALSIVTAIQFLFNKFVTFGKRNRETVKD